MPSVIFSNMHPRVFDSFCVLFNSIGWKVYIPSLKGHNYFGYGSLTIPSIGNYQELTYDEFLQTKPDVVLCLCDAQLKYSIKLARRTRSKLVLRSGNNNVKYTKKHSSFLISNDIQTYEKSDVQHKLFFYLPPDYNLFTRQRWCADSNIVTSYIQCYNSQWQNCWNVYNRIRLQNTDLAFLNFGAEVKNYPYNPFLLNKQDIVRTLSISRCVLHLKEAEGYGWSLLESLSCGIPVVVSKQYVVGKTCEKFLIDKLSAIYLNDLNDVTEFRKVFEDTKLLQTVSEKSYKFIRNLIIPQEQYNKVKLFLENVVLV